GETYHLKRIVREGKRTLLRSDNPEIQAVEAGPDCRAIALLLTKFHPESLAPRTGEQMAFDEVATSFGISSQPKAPWSRVDGHLFVLLERKNLLSAPDKVTVRVGNLRPSETAFVLGKMG